MCKGDINRHQPKIAKINLGLNHHVLNSRTALTRRAILNTLYAYYAAKAESVINTLSSVRRFDYGC